MTMKNVDMITDKICKILIERKIVNLVEERSSLSQEEIMITWEDLTEEFGEVDIEQLASFLGASKSMVRKLLPKKLSITPAGRVVKQH